MRSRYQSRNRISPPLPAVAAALALLVMSGCGGDDGSDMAEHRIRVRTAPVMERELSIPVMTSGVLSAEKEVRLSFKTGGIIGAFFADKGDIVERGKILARLDLSEIEAQAVQARSAFAKAERDLERVRNLYADSAATLEQFQDAATGLEMARSARSMAEFNLRHSTIRAPSDGRILERFAEPDELVGPGTPIFMFGSTEKGWVVRCGVADRDIVNLQIGDSASVSFDAYPGIDFEASINGIAQAADPMTGTYEVEMRLGPSKERLFSGFTAKAEIYPSGKNGYMLVPIESVIDADRGAGHLFVISPGGGSVTRVPVTIMLIMGDEVAVTGGLSGGDLVVTDGAPYLSGGSAVEVVE